MYILHLSDLHFGTPDQANLWSGQLAEDLRQELEINQINCFILSGDIANYSTPEEYQAAKQFLDEFRQDFSLEPEQIIVVPGNHDLNWSQSKKSYNLKDREDCQPDELEQGKYIKVSEDVVRVRNEGEYKKRFANFSTFYETIKGKPYPPDYNQQYTLNHLKDQNLLILGLNSAWQLDHEYKDRASINNNALTNALREISRNETYSNCPIKIAVWHHPLHSPYQDRIKDESFLGRLAVNGFQFFLHGHVHQAQTDFYRYDTAEDGRKLHRICAGTFGAGTSELVTATPWQYNLLKFENNQLTVHTRKRETENGAWESDPRWRQGPGQQSLDYYTINLSI